MAPEFQVRTFPLCFDDTDPGSVHENASQPEMLVSEQGLCSGKRKKNNIFFPQVHTMTIHLSYGNSTAMN
jgi:hypothetical protein